MAYQKYGQHDSAYVADSPEDLNNLPQCSMGSTCYIISNATKYMINSEGEWIPQNMPISADGSVDISNLATKAEISQLRDLVNTKQDWLVDGQNIKTINGQSILGIGDVYADQTVWEGVQE
jgi:hypothetical protein